MSVRVTDVGAARVVKASHRLTPGAKLVWLEVHVMASIAARKRDGRGCFLSGPGLAARLGLSERTVTDYRTDLKGLGLLEGTLGRAASWWATLPRECLASSGDPDEIERARVLLDEHIERRRNPRSGPEILSAGIPEESPTGNGHFGGESPAESPMESPMESPIRDVTEGRRGGGAPPQDLPEGKAPLPHPPSPSEDARAHAQREGEQRERFASDWRRRLRATPGDAAEAVPVRDVVREVFERLQAEGTT